MNEKINFLELIMSDVILVKKKKYSIIREPY